MPIAFRHHSSRYFRSLDKLILDILSGILGWRFEIDFDSHSGSSGPPALLRQQPVEKELGSAFVQRAISIATLGRLNTRWTALLTVTVLQQVANPLQELRE